jgi:tetratricopeptide (TPR) repeat protein
LALSDECHYNDFGLNQFQKNLFQLHVRQFTGKVTFTRDHVTKTIFFKKGVPIYVSSSVRSETLGQMLLEKGQLTSEQYQKTIEVMEQTKKRQGEVLVELGYMTAYQVFEALKEQADKKFENCLLMEGAQVNLERGEEHLEGIPDLSIDFFRIFLDLAALHGVEEDESLPTDKAVAITPAGREFLRNKALKSNETKTLRSLDGTQTCPDLVTNAPDSGAAEALLHALHALNFLEFRDPPPQKFARPAADVIRGDPTPVPKSDRATVTIDEKHQPDTTVQPIYAWALKLDRPYTELLGVGVTTTKPQIRKMYETLIRELHLDSIEQNYPEKDRKIAEDVFNRITLAYTVLGDDKRRHEYVNDLANRRPPKEPTQAVAAEVHLQKAKILSGKKQFAQAEKEILAAVEKMPEDSAYVLALADLQMHRAAAEKVPLPDSIEALFKKALTLNSAEPEIYFQYGIYAKVKEDFEKAKSCFGKVLEMQPNNNKASSELRLVNQRLEGKKKSASSLFSFLKKK